MLRPRPQVTSNELLLNNPKGKKKTFWYISSWNLCKTFFKITYQTTFLSNTTTLALLSGWSKSFSIRIMNLHLHRYTHWFLIWIQVDVHLKKKVLWDMLGSNHHSNGLELDSTDKRNEMISPLLSRRHSRRRRKNTTLSGDVVLPKPSQTRTLSCLTSYTETLVWLSVQRISMHSAPPITTL